MPFSVVLYIFCRPVYIESRVCVVKGVVKCSFEYLCVVRQDTRRQHNLGVGAQGGGTLMFSAYVGSDPASTVYPKKISGILSTPQKYLKF